MTRKILPACYLQTLLLVSTHAGTPLADKDASVSLTKATTRNYLSQWTQHLDQQPLYKCSRVHTAKYA